MPSLESDGAEVDMRKGLVVLIVLVVIALILGSSFISRRNQMAIKREAKIAANGQLDSALGRLLVIVENYPQLKSNENFERLQDELAGTENRIAVERRRYN